ncbi:FHA domain-containing protein [Pyxidicoccus parkwayensis]|uniref:FHA domain-containing protein n=1 Tax=Pyxidicoccus parkwayensis TaxID=2813578 RepID=A0ABX7PBB8_9BACT|nr:FHA domain-containing protein [Pyxidicoccus parkwaysis]QSQ27833.1 FHA domain-containing protein [Pyxidicoccus parkwaysis]
MAPPNPKRPPRPPRPPGTQAPKDSDVELPFDDDEVDPLRADDPRPQRVPQYPAGSRRSRRQGSEHASHDRELAPRFDWSHEYSDPGHPPAFLYVERGPGLGQLVPVKQGSLVMGRSSSSDLRLQHPSISRRHAQLTRRADRFYLKDLSSQNGTFLNRNRVTTEVEVQPGDEVSMGNALLRLRGPGGTPALGVPAVTATTTVPDGGRKKGPGTLGVAIIAAVLGSAVAALVTGIAVGLGGDDAEAPAKSPTKSVTQLASMEPELAAVSTAGQTPTGSAASASGSQVAAPTGVPSGTGTGAQQTAANPEAAERASGTEVQTPRIRIEVTPGPSASDVARGVARASVAKLERSEAATSAHDVATRPGTSAEADVLKRYEAGEVSVARERARAAQLHSLYTQLARFENAEAEFHKALLKQDLPRAITQLTTAVTVDEALAAGRSRHGPQLRKQLADLHVQAGTAHGRAGRVDAARASFEQALKYDAGHREAREQLEKLSPSAAP